MYNFYQNELIEKNNKKRLKELEEEDKIKNKRKSN